MSPRCRLLQRTWSRSVKFGASTRVGIDSAFSSRSQRTCLWRMLDRFFRSLPGFPYAVGTAQPGALWPTRTARCRRGTRWRTVQLVDRNADIRGAGRSAVDVSRRWSSPDADPRARGGNDGRGV